MIKTSFSFFFLQVKGICFFEERKKYSSSPFWIWRNLPPQHSILISRLKSELYGKCDRVFFINNPEKNQISVVSFSFKFSNFSPFLNLYFGVRNKTRTKVWCDILGINDRNRTPTLILDLIFQTNFIYLKTEVPIFEA